MGYQNQCNIFLIDLWICDFIVKPKSTNRTYALDLNWEHWQVPWGGETNPINQVLVFLSIQLHGQRKGNDILMVIEAVKPNSFPWALTLKKKKKVQLHYFPFNPHCFSEDNLKQQVKNNIAKCSKTSSGKTLGLFHKKNRLFLSPLAGWKLNLGEEKMFYLYFIEKRNSK